MTHMPLPHSPNAFCSVLGVLLLFFSFSAQAWWDTDWAFKGIFVANNGGATLTDQQVQIDLNASNVNPDYVWSSDGRDFRALAADDSTPLEYYIESWDSIGETATIYVQIPSLPPGDTSINVYYGNTLVSDASNPLLVLTETGLRYHTRNSSFNPSSRAQALAEFNSLDDSVAGYGCATVTAFNNISNQSVFDPNRNNNILFFSNNHFEVDGTNAGQWDFRFAGDYGRGGGLYLDGTISDEKWGDDLWWGFNWNNTAEILTVSGTLGIGFHNLQMIGAEGCCDGGTSVEYRNVLTGFGANDWQSWTTGSVNIRSEKCAVVNITTTNNSSSLTTSTKTVDDLNGADVEVGDVLRYTLTLTETNGVAAEHVSVLDNIPSEVDSLVVISTPVGTTDTSATTGGTFGSGYVEVSDITVPANGSVTIVFEVQVQNVPIATTIDNSYLITNPSGFENTTVNAPQLTVAVNSIPVAGVKQLYLYDNQDLSRVEAVADEGSVVIADGETRTWTLTPQLQSELTINKGTDMTVDLFVQRSGDLGAANRTIRIEALNGADVLLASHQSTINIPAAAVWHQFPITMTHEVTPASVALGDVVKFSIENLSSAGDDLLLNQSGTVSSTEFSFPSSTVINVDDISIFHSAFPGVLAAAAAQAGTTIYIRALISDPFGFADITGATLTLDDPTPTNQLSGAAMTSVDAGGALRTFEYAYAVPGDPVQGFWSMTVIAAEGTEGTITDTALQPMWVIEPPLVTVTTAANVANALPGDTVVYTHVTTNTGDGVALSVTPNEMLPDYVALRMDTHGGPFLCSSGCPASGLTLGTPEYSSDNGATWTYNLVSGAGGAPANYDSVVTNWRIPMSGTMNGSGASFEITFEVVVQ